MGSVYGAEHAETGQRVAIKVLHAERAREASLQRSFRREVQALAKLHHPSIAAVLDYGEIRASMASHGLPKALVEGTPWFAMELVSGRPVGRVAGRWRWPQLSAFLRATLDALAHAHARSVIHRDLKPSNILVSAAPEPTVTLVDFGIAQIFDRLDGQRSNSVVGTPTYMAPEQIVGEWRDQGPWTDLYALGCLTWRVVCKELPYSGSPRDVFVGHLHHPLPDFEPTFPVPEGFEPWLRSLLRKDIDSRIQCAADAVWALHRLGQPVGVERGRDTDYEPESTHVLSADAVSP